MKKTPAVGSFEPSYILIIAQLFRKVKWFFKLFARQTYKLQLCFCVFCTILANVHQTLSRVPFSAERYAASIRSVRATASSMV